MPPEDDTSTIHATAKTMLASDKLADTMITRWVNPHLLNDLLHVKWDVNPTYSTLYIVRSACDCPLF